MNLFFKGITGIFACAALLNNGVNAFNSPNQNAIHSTKSALNVPENSPVLSPRKTSILAKGRTSNAFGISKVKRGGAKLSSQSVDELEDTGSTSLIPSAFFLLSAASLAKLAVDIKASSIPDSIGTWALFFTTIAVGWDNFVIGIGQPLFSDVKTNESKYNVLKTLSYPRFTAHAVLVPFLYPMGAEIGKAMGIEWLQGDLTQTIMVVAAAALGIISRIRFVGSPGIEIADTSDSPPDAWENSLLWFTYKEPEFLYIVPSIVLSLFNLAIGVSGLGMEGDSRTAAIYMIVSAAAVLVGNAKPSYITRFTGNLGEVVMLWAIFAAGIAVL
jgi:hypothetical protein